MNTALARIGISLLLAAIFVSARPPVPGGVRYAVCGMQAPPTDASTSPRLRSVQALSTSNPQLTTDLSVTWLETKEHDFGTLQRGRPAAHRFVFKNTGSKPLIIDNVRTPCGCTAVEWPEAPIAPGDTAAIVVEFNAAQTGYFYKVVKVFFRGIRGGDRLVVAGSVE
jgi:hypothetical protein